jgi:hypothetical protein
LAGFFLNLASQFIDGAVGLIFVQHGDISFTNG